MLPFTSPRTIARDANLKWIHKNLIPQVISDNKIAGGPSSHELGYRVFSFDGRDIDIKLIWEENNSYTVRLRQMNDPEVAFFFAEKPSLFGERFKIAKHAIHPKDLSEVVARLKAFGEHYLSNPLTRFTYATPGEYIGWPDRSIVEPERDPTARSIEELDAEHDKLYRDINRRMRGCSLEERIALEEEAKTLRDARSVELSKTTHGRWLERNKGRMDAEFESYVDRMVAAMEDENKDDPSPEP